MTGCQFTRPLPVPRGITDLLFTLKDYLLRGNIHQGRPIQVSSDISQVCHYLGQPSHCKNKCNSTPNLVAAELPQIWALPSGADPGFLEREFICINEVGFALLIYLIFLKYPTKMK